MVSEPQRRRGMPPVVIDSVRERGIRPGAQAMRALIVLASLLLTYSAQSRPYRPTMTGAQYVRDMLAPPDGGMASLRRERAMGYLDGVMEVTVGIQWCPAGENVGHELNYLAAEKMQSMPAHELQKSAAALVIDVLGKLYPCTRQGVNP